MLKAKSRWMVKPSEKEKADHLVEHLNIEPMVAKLLVNRGIESIEDADCFLNKEKQSFFDPFLLSDMKIAIDRINEAISNNEKILIFGDYDADGVTSTTVMLSALKEKGADVEFYIPNRFTEGYGPNEHAFRWAKDAGFTLIITVDTGISAIHESEVAKELGLDLIITDHHEPSPQLPDALAIVHPRKPGGTYPFGELAGVGVAFKVAHALLGRVPSHLLQFAAIGTIADLVPLHSENRLIAALGLKELQKTTNPGIKSLLKVTGADEKGITEETIGFVLGPRINAVGRLGSADPAVHLLTTDDQSEAEELSKEIDHINRERQLLVSQLTEEAIDEVEKNYSGSENRVLVIAREGWNAGVIGIVASRLVEKFYRPTIVLSIDNEKGEAKGSARSIVGFDLFANLSTCRDILPHFGGHTMAAGMTLDINHIDELRKRLNDLAFEILTEEDFTPITEIDAVCSIEEAKIETIEELNQLSPFGVGNPKPVIMLGDMSFNQMRRIGSDNSHLKVVLQKDGQALDSIGFGCGDLCNAIAPHSQIDVIGQLSINEWNGYRKPQLMIQDIAVKEWQLFDLRGSNQIDKQIQQISKQERATIAFQKKTLDKAPFKNIKSEIICIEEEKDAKLECEALILLDLPYDKKDLEDIINRTSPGRIYAVFSHEEEHFFSTLPTREHFKWFYGFLLKQKTFDLQKHAYTLSKRKGWSKETIDFIARVFYDLEFVKIENGIIQLNEKPAKKDIKESKTYQRKQMQMEMEQELLYSSYSALKASIDLIMQGSLRIKEEMV